MNCVMPITNICRLSYMKDFSVALFGYVLLLDSTSSALGGADCENMVYLAPVPGGLDRR